MVSFAENKLTPGEFIGYWVVNEENSPGVSFRG